ncbi:MAG: DNA polymerase III subunit gamma/tau [Bacilli bacterium]|nr:DNA polymerase III subunit gamma/tau [Bacilli bacterium]
MSYKVLYRKYRPDSFDNVVGQDYTVKMLKNAINTGKHSHAYIFTGPRGTGKTSSAKIFAKALNCENPVDGNPCGKCEACLSFNENPDIIEIDAASNNGVDEIRELINNVKLVPSNSKYKVYIIDEVHMLTTSAFNALLLTLEEPPAHVVFILATTDIQNVPITILSRCQRFDFKPVSMDAMVDRLKYVCKQEKIKIDDDAINEIALISAGGMRDALGMLDQLSSDDSKITLDRVSSYFGSVSVKRVDELLDALGNNNVQLLLEIIQDISNSGNNYAVFVKKLIEELRKYAIDIKLGNKDYGLYFEDIYSLIFDLNECLGNININVDPYSLIEIVLLKYVSGNKVSKPQTVTEIAPKTETIIEDKSPEVSPGNNIVEEEKAPEIVEEPPKKKGRPKKEEVINKAAFDISVRINNCFVDCSRPKKKEVSDSWINFQNFLMGHDRSLISLLADTTILAASDKYVLIQNNSDSTNALINESINNIEKYYEEFSGNKVRFAALDSALWKEESTKFINNKGKVKYEYIEEDNSDNIDNQQSVDKKDGIEDVAKEIFGTFEVE